MIYLSPMIGKRPGKTDVSEDGAAVTVQASAG
jgi:hypothetical protein